MRTTFCEDITRATMPGPFVAVGAISHLPFSGANAGRGLSIEGRPHDPDNPVNANYRLICPGYFRTLSIPFVRGRDIASTDREPVVVINRAMADRYWKDDNPIGQRIRIGRTDGAPWMRIVGVVENVHHFGLDSDPVREIFVPYRQNAWPVMTLVAKTRGGITPAAAFVLREALRRADPTVPPTSVKTMDEVLARSLTARTSSLRLLAVFAALGLLLAAIGIYGVIAYYVSQRVHELGIRVALGATRSAIVRLVLRQALLPITAGVAIGAIASNWSGRLLTDLLYHTEPNDALVIGSICAVVLTVGIAASWIPAYRAASVDPTTILRQE